MPPSRNGTNKSVIPTLDPFIPVEMSGRNRLHTAILQEFTHDLAKGLISDGQIDVNERDGSGNTAVFYATLRDYPDVVEMLVERGADVNIANKAGSNALYVCAMSAGAATARSLVRGGANIDAVNAISTGTALHMAACSGNLGVIEVLLLEGATLDLLTSNGESPIFLAASKGRADVVRILLCAKANWQLPCRGLTALGVAIRLEHNPVVREFQQQISFERLLSGGIFLKHAAGLQNLELLSILCEGGIVDLAGGALCRAVRLGREGSVAFLLDQAREVRADFSSYVNLAHDDNGFSALECCFVPTCLKPRILRRLIDKGLCTEVCKEMILRSDTPNDETKARLDAMLHLTQRVPAIKAISWGWPLDVQESKMKNKSELTTTSFVVTNVRPKSGVFLAALLRKKNDDLFVG